MVLICEAKQNVLIYIEAKRIIDQKLMGMQTHTNTYCISHILTVRAPHGSKTNLSKAYKQKGETRRQRKKMLDRLLLDLGFLLERLLEEKSMQTHFDCAWMEG